LLWALAGWGTVVAALVLLVGLPLWKLFAAALGDGWGPVRRTLTGGGSGTAVVNTAWTAAAATLLAVTVGAATAFVTERSHAPGRRALRAALLASLLAAPLVSALGWAQAYGPAGLSDQLLGVHWAGLFGPAGIVVVIAAGAAPLAYLVVAAGLAARAEPELELAARASGAGGGVAVRTITLPLSRPAIGAAATLVFVGAVNAFEVPAVLGIPAGFATMTTRLYEDLTLSADPQAFTSAVVLAAALVVLALVLVGAADTVAGGAAVPRTGGASGSLVRAGRRSWGLAVAAWAFLLLGTALPLVALVLVALTRGVGLPPVPANWTLANFAAALDGHAGAALAHSLLLAATAATAVVLLGGLVVALGRRGPGRALGTAVTLTFAVAGSALAVAVLLAYGRLLRDTLAIILVAYLAKFWALGHRPIAGAADRLPADLPRAARASGAGPVTAVTTVVAPLLRPALAVGWLLVFLFAVHELTISSLLYGPGSETLAVVILNRQQLGDVTITSALSVLLTVFAIAGGVLLVVVRRAAARWAEPS
jgi:iron(III) transport system permease protein